MKVVRSFGVRTDNPNLLCYIDQDLDKELCDLQNAGWEIISVTNIPCKQYEYRVGYYDSVVFTIVASHEE